MVLADSAALWGGAGEQETGTRGRFAQSLPHSLQFLTTCLQHLFKQTTHKESPGDSPVCVSHQTMSSLRAETVLEPLQNSWPGQHWLTGEPGQCWLVGELAAVPHSPSAGNHSPPPPPQGLIPRSHQQIGDGACWSSLGRVRPQQEAGLKS